MKFLVLIFVLLIIYTSAQPRGTSLRRELKNKGGKKGKKGKAAKGGNKGKAAKGGMGGTRTDGGGTVGIPVERDDFSRTPSGNLIIPIPMNSVVPHLMPTPAPIGTATRDETPTVGAEVSFGSTSPPVSPAPVGGGSCLNGSYFQQLSDPASHCSEENPCESGCCLYPYCLCGEFDEELFPQVYCLEA